MILIPGNFRQYFRFSSSGYFKHFAVYHFNNKRFAFAVLQDFVGIDHLAFADPDKRRISKIKEIDIQERFIGSICLEAVKPDGGL